MFSPQSFRLFIIIFDLNNVFLREINLSFMKLSFKIIDFSIKIVISRILFLDGLSSFV
jgi:hypothetical protein